MKTAYDIEADAATEYDFSSGVRGSQQRKYSLNMAGEFFVAAELNRRGIYASVTYGAAKNADVLAFDQETRQTAVVEVKTTASPNRKWITGGHSIDLKNIHPHLFWVLTLLPAEEEGSGPRYFVFSSKELVEVVSHKHQEYRNRYQERNGVAFQDNKGVYSVTIEEAEAMHSEGQWSKIVDWLAHSP